FPGRAERVGPHVVSITLDRPDAALLATLSQPFFALQSPRQLADEKAAVPVGTGPFRLASAKPGRVELGGPPEYWGGPPRLRGVVCRRLKDEDALVQALADGEVDLSAAVGQDRVARLRGDPGLSLDSQTGLNVAFLSVNNAHGAFRDARVRTALAKAV